MPNKQRRRRGVAESVDHGDANERWRYSTINTEELTQIEDRNKQFLYVRAVHANHMIQYHTNEILERQRVVDEY